jgi:tungstate transport system ATP-binding protein
VLRAADVGRRFGDETVFSGVSLSVETGEVVAMIGPSGAGKTTLLRLLALFERPDEGRIEYDGVDPWSVSEERRLDLRRSIGMVFQEASLFDASVRRNVAYGIRVRRPWPSRVAEWLGSLVDGSETPDAAREALEVVGLEDGVDQDASSLSGGEAQRVAFARALAYDPDVLFLDEPTSDLDPRNTAVIEEAITDARGRDLGVVVATHDMNQASRVADRVAVLLDGRVVEVGPTDDIFGDPDDERTRKFITGELVY